MTLLDYKLLIFKDAILIFLNDNLDYILDKVNS